MENTCQGPWYYEQNDLGFNYRMTELQAALGVSQMKLLSEFVAARHQLAARYNEKLADLPVTLPYQLPHTYSGLHLYVIRLHLDKITKSHQQVFKELREAGIAVNVHYIPVHLQPYYQKMGFKSGDYPEAERYYTEAISIPMFHGMTLDQQDSVITALTTILAD
jgi:dTDP-4-amino-4,6-dideoxygalactose transaminase